MTYKKFGPIRQSRKRNTEKPMFGQLSSPDKTQKETNSMFGEPIFTQKPKPLSETVRLYHTSEVTTQELMDVLFGIQKMQSECGARVFVEMFNDTESKRQGILSPTEILKASSNPRDFKAINSVLHRNNDENYAYANIFITHLPSTNGYWGVNYGNNNIISTSTFKHNPKGLQTVAAHEFGHFLGLVARNYNIIENLGLHCNGEKGPCVMRQVRIDEMSKTINSTHILCEDCHEELNTNNNTWRVNHS